VARDEQLQPAVSWRAGVQRRNSRSGEVKSRPAANHGQMLNSPPMAAAAPAHVIDALNSLLEAEINSVFRTINEGSPYLSRATAEVRRPLAACGQLSRQHAQELARLIESLGGTATPRQLP